MSSLRNGPLEKVRKAWDGRGRHGSETFEPRCVRVHISPATISPPCCFTFGCNGSPNSHAGPSGQESRAPHGGGLTWLLQSLMRNGGFYACLYFTLKKKVTRILRFSHNDIWYHAMRKRQHPERLSLQGFNIARGLLDTCRQSQRKFNIVVLRLPPSSSREITLSPILSACKELAFKQTPQVSELSMSFRQTECTPKINVIVFSPELLPSGGTMQKQ